MANIKKIRADLALFERGMCESRERARVLILAGKARLGADHVLLKPSQLVAVDADLRLEDECPYVSRGAYKLAPSLERHLPDLIGMVAMDVGASTGGFTDLMLQRGAARVYAVDVGTGQLHHKLRSDPRVEVMERVNARYLTAESIPELVDLISMDVSFISARKVLPALASFLKPGGWCFVLVKPQFEAGRAEAKDGVVRDDLVRTRCAAEVADFAADSLGWRRVDAVDSPIAGPKGNREILLVLQNPPRRARFPDVGANE